MTRSIFVSLSALVALFSLNARALPPPASSASAAAAAAPASIEATSHEATPAVPLRASERSDDPVRIQGIERQAVLPGDGTRKLETGLLLPVRKVLEGQFLFTEASARLATVLKFAPRADDFFSTKEGAVKLLPTFFFETRHPVSFGARVAALGPHGEASFALASGGPNDVFALSHLVLSGKKPTSPHLLLEGMYDSRNELEFLGVGQVPDKDPRNVFKPDTIHDSFYLEKRSRAIVSLDTPIAHGFSVVPSSSILVSRVSDSVGSGTSGLNEVFEPTTLIKSADETRIVYSELALRFDTRRNWVSRDPGAQLEGYAGYGTGVAGNDFRYLGAGGRAVLFVPVVRRSNTFSAKVVLDTVTPLDGTQLPFTALVRQFEYRGFDLRRDKISLIASLDYRWVLSHYIAARLFVDGASVAPRFDNLFTSPPRIAAGFGFDIFTYHTDLVRFALSGSADGVRVLLGLGPAVASGDRQHRN